MEMGAFERPFGRRFAPPGGRLDRSKQCEAFPAVGRDAGIFGYFFLT
jgi:hypothetical protein